MLCDSQVHGDYAKEDVGVQIERLAEDDLTMGDRRFLHPSDSTRKHGAISVTATVYLILCSRILANMKMLDMYVYILSGALIGV